MKIYCCDSCINSETKNCASKIQMGLDPKLVYIPLNLKNNEEYLESLKTDLDYFKCGECGFIV